MPKTPAVFESCQVCLQPAPCEELNVKIKASWICSVVSVGNAPRHQHLNPWILIILSLNFISIESSEINFVGIFESNIL